MARLYVLALALLLAAFRHALAVEDEAAHDPASVREIRVGVIGSSLMLKCDSADAQMQFEEFAAHPDLESACAPHVWLEHLLGAQARHVTVLDIGCNKGYTSAEIFDRYAPELGINGRALHNVYLPLKKSDTKVQYLACNDEVGLVHTTPYKPYSRSIDVHCFEPGEHNYKSLQTARKALFGEAANPDDTPLKASGVVFGRWHLHNMAVSSQSGTAAFTSGCQSELCTLLPAGASEYTVKVTTIDDFLASLTPIMGSIPIIKIDTEGFDIDVMKGARNTLKAKAVKVIMFEYSGSLNWNVTSGGYHLRDWMATLEASGYVCYYDGAPWVYKLSRGCWLPGYEDHKWRNVVCAAANTQAELILDAFSYLRQVKARTAHSSAGAATSS